MKQTVKLALGLSVYVYWRLLAPRRIEAAKDKFFASHGLSFMERQLVAFLMAITPQDTKTATNHWAGSAGSRFHAHQDHRLTLDLVAQDEFYRRPMLDQFAAAARQSLTAPATIVEVGCGAGGNLLYLRRLLGRPSVNFVGYDINNDVIESNKSLIGEDLSFETRNCFTERIAAPGDLGLICCAVLMYAQEADIRAFLQNLVRSHSGRVLVGLSEPVRDPDAAGSAPHNNLAFTHGYRRIFTALDFRPTFETVAQEPGKDSRIYHAVFELSNRALPARS